jgi:hypothetical protein
VNSIRDEIAAGGKTVRNVYLTIMASLTIKVSIDESRRPRLLIFLTRAPITARCVRYIRRGPYDPITLHPFDAK